MLILSRKPGQTIVLEFHAPEIAAPVIVTVHIVGMKHSHCSIGIDAGPEVHVRRGELTEFPRKTPE